jgi:hypothetical protein
VNPQANLAGSVSLSRPPSDQYPYLVTRLAPAFYHLQLLPDDRTEAELVDLGRRQIMANRLRGVVVLGPNRCTYLEPDGSAVPSTDPPRGGVVVCGLLQPLEPLPNTPAAHARLAALRRGLGKCPDGFVMGDLTKGGRRPTPAELRALSAPSTTGVPTGLSRCAVCGEWRGRCLDPSPLFQGLVMEVACRCEADARCARCGGPLAERKLNANYWDPLTRQIWHVPGFTAATHRCSGRPS